MEKGGNDYFIYTKFKKKYGEKYRNCSWKINKKIYFCNIVQRLKKIVNKNMKNTQQYSKILLTITYFFGILYYGLSLLSQYYFRKWKETWLRRTRMN